MNMPELCQESPVDIHNNTCCNESVKHAACNYQLLSHIKYDFYNKASDVVVQVYVKEIREDYLDVTFEENALTMCFKTRSKEFLKLHFDSSEETLFEWRVNLRHGITRNQSKYKTSKGKITLVLRKQKGGKWNSLYSLCLEETINPALKTVVNGGQVAVDRSNISDNTTNSTPGISCKVNGEQNNILKSISNNTSDLIVDIDDYYNAEETQEENNGVILNDGRKEKETIKNSEKMNGGCPVLSNNCCQKDTMQEDNEIKINNCSTNNDTNGKPNKYTHSDIRENCSTNSENTITTNDTKEKINYYNTGRHTEELPDQHAHTTTVEDNLCGKSNDCGVELVITPAPEEEPISHSIWQDNEWNSQGISGCQSTAASNGETFSSNSETFTSNGETFTSNGETLTSNGETLTSKGETLTSNGETLTSNRETLTSNGETVTSNGETLTLIGETLTSNVETFTPNGETLTSNVETFVVDNKDETSEEIILSYDEKVHYCRPGSTGLINIKNMCYINSIVQCLSAVGKFRKYLLSKKHHSDINRNSKHGFGGDLIACFGSLVNTMWSGKERNVSANKLKDILGRKHRSFDHVGQGDAQEFLTFLLDGLHEDLKNENKKLIGEQDTECQRNIVENGVKYWQKFINGNHSIIIDLFHGQTVSEIQCQDCKKPSVRFDPWMQLNLPIPNEPKYISIYVFFLDPSSKPLQVKLEVSDGTHCAELLKQISQLVKVPADHLILISPSYNRIAHIFNETEDISYCQIKEYLIACQLVKHENNLEEKEEGHEDLIQDCNKNAGIQDCDTLLKADDVQDSRILRISVIQRSTRRIIIKCSSCSSEKSGLKYCSKCFRVAYCNSECQTKHWKSHRSSCNFLPDVIGYPFILSIPASEATLDELKKKALQYSRYSVTPKEGELDNVLLHLRLLKNISDFQSKGKVLTQTGTTPVVNDDVCIALDWESSIADQKVQSKQLDCDDHDSANRKLSTEDKTSSLEECLDLYWKPEIIRKETGWRCDYCKDVRPASRKVKIFRLANNMIIHIKRFSYEGNGRKVKKDVSFPLTGLDMTPYTYHESLAGKAIYDLDAVCTHQGVMDYGHYVTYAKPYSSQELANLGLTDTDGWLMYNDNNVACISKSHVEKAEAYILFYQRRDVKTTVNEPTKVSCNFISNVKEASTSPGPIVNRTAATQSDYCKNDDLIVEKDEKMDDTCTSPCNNIPHLNIRDIALEDELD